MSRVLPGGGWCCGPRVRATAMVRGQFPLCSRPRTNCCDRQHKPVRSGPARVSRQIERTCRSGNDSETRCDQLEVTAVPLVAGVDSSTQSCKVVIRDAETGALVREGRAAHPTAPRSTRRPGGPRCRRRSRQAGGLDDVAAISVGGQQHGMVCLDEHGEVVRPALLWNDTRSAARGDRPRRASSAVPHAWVDAVGLVPVASFTVTKLRWLAEHEPEQRRPDRRGRAPPRLADVAARPAPTVWTRLRTDRGDASGTGYWSPTVGRLPARPGRHGARQATSCCRRCSARPSRAGETATGVVARARHRRQHGRRARTRRRAGHGDRLDRHVRRRVGGHDDAGRRRDGVVAGFADATGRFLPLVATLNAARVLDATAGCSASTTTNCPGSRSLRRLARTGWCSCRTSRASARRTGPNATGALHGLRLGNSDARAPRPGRGRGAALRAARRGSTRSNGSASPSTE